MQSEVLRIMVGASRRTKLCNLRAVAQFPEIIHRVYAMRRPHNPSTPTPSRVSNKSLPTARIFQGKTWVSKTARGIKSLQLQTPSLVRTTNVSHPDYKHKPQWQEPTLCFSATTLTKRKVGLTIAALTLQAQQPLVAVNDENAEAYISAG